MLNYQCKRRLTWSPKRIDSTNQKRRPAVAWAHCDVFQAPLPWQGIVKLYKGSMLVTKVRLCNDQISHPKSGYVTTKLHGTCGCNNNAMFSGRAIFMFPTVVVCRPRESGPGKALTVHAKCKYGSTVEIIVFRVQYFLSAYVACQIL